MPEQANHVLDRKATRLARVGHWDYNRSWTMWTWESLFPSKRTRIPRLDGAAWFVCPHRRPSRVHTTKVAPVLFAVMWWKKVGLPECHMQNLGFLLARRLGWVFGRKGEPWWARMDQILTNNRKVAFDIRLRGSCGSYRNWRQQIFCCAVLVHNSHWTNDAFAIVIYKQSLDLMQCQTCQHNRDSLPSRAPAAPI